MSKELKEGDKAPDFDMPTDGAGNVSLAGHNGKAVVLYFYPKDDTSGCTLEAQQFSKLRKDFDNVGAVVIGVSKDSVKSHDKFKDKIGINYNLASDEGSGVCEDYGTWVEKSMYGRKYMGISRDTFLIDRTGKIARIWRKVKPDGHAAEVLEAVKAL